MIRLLSLIFYDNKHEEIIEYISNKKTTFNIQVIELIWIILSKIGTITSKTNAITVSNFVWRVGITCNVMCSAKLKKN